MKITAIASGAFLLSASGTLFGVGTIECIYHNSFSSATESGVGGAAVVNTAGMTMGPNSGSGYMNYVGDGYANPEGADPATNAYNTSVNFAHLKVNNGISWNSSFTFSVAVKANQTTAPNNWRNLFAIGGDSTTSDHLRVQNNSGWNTGLWGNGKLSAAPDNLNMNNQGYAIQQGTYALYSVVWEVVDGKGQVSLYVDGDLVSNSQNAVDVATLGNLTRISIGGDLNVTGNPFGAMYFDEVSIYNGALSSQQIKENLVGNYAPESIIPEPSAFGLLAGLGVLAFATSRRRRSRKIA